MALNSGLVRIENQIINLPILEEKKITLFIKREDKIHPVISGNKFRKLKYNLKEAKNSSYKGLLTFGGAYSNHIAAVACAANENNLASIGIIRGEELAFKWQDNPTLQQAVDFGMQLKFVSRSDYRKKDSPVFIEKLGQDFPEYYLVPEGGTNELAVKGCTEILTFKDETFDLICCAVGTGGTISGLINSIKPKQRVLGFPALKGDFLREDICKFAANRDWDLQLDYNFGGYAKVTPELIRFINEFKKTTDIPLDPVYTGKMMFGIVEMVKNDVFREGTKLLAIHTGGLQGIEGMNRILKKKDLPLIDL
ncbi:1-aminocyclopropane-1-carboxylate deaminase/D-cysteine desulfhydrase [Maribacter sp. HTCC2170]|uniref:1-aminocyclopropane-1-carboxylate deaminase/D-cysteine desulfhydrase n=1 Tax=Maribacter sp. (strain HTCC2170 / KCCM 42371) TaxID=313603 RepID=UPI00006AE5EB|nr:pyridoxal-phosphate dependent enzyme [Maribacter sp. HTCC2170]EAR00608.1 putative D-cysteine desulfhydrase (DcyD) [Maribacter sp. HTCC2170]